MDNRGKPSTIRVQDKQEEVVVDPVLDPINEDTESTPLEELSRPAPPKRQTTHKYHQELLQFCEPVLQLPNIRPAPKPTNLARQAITTSILDRPKPQEEEKGSGAFNVGYVDFNWLSDKSGLLRQPLPKCDICQAYMCSFSAPKDGQWHCDFCSNVIKVGLVRPPQKAATLHVQAVAQAPSQEQPLGYILCIDVSGSMNNTITVDDPITRAQHFTEQSPFSSVYDVLKKVINQIIEQIHQCSPSARVGLVFFSNCVKVCGDCSKDPVIIGPETSCTSCRFEADSLANATKLYATVKRTCAGHLTRPIRDCKAALLEALDSESPDRATALGPALVASRALLTGCSRGSQVLVFTDGAANLGCGNLEEQHDTGFYDRSAEYYKKAGIVVSFFAIEGAHCDLHSLLPIATATNGVVRKSRVLDLEKEIELHYDRGLATNIELKLILHPWLKLANSPASSYAFPHPVLQRSYTEARYDAMCCFEYQLASNVKLSEAQACALPVQVQITYTEGDVTYLRVATELILLTPHRPPPPQLNYPALLRFASEIVQTGIKQEGTLPKLRTLANAIQYAPPETKDRARADKKTCLAKLKELITQTQEAGNSTQAVDVALSTANKHVTTSFPYADYDTY